MLWLSGGGTSLAAQSGVDALLADGKYQEAAWAAREAGDSSRADAILARLETILRAAPVSARPLSMDSQGVSYTYRLDHGQGVQSIFKVDSSDIFCRGCGSDREAAAYAVDRLLEVDLTPMTVLTRIVVSGDTLDGSAMYFVDHALSSRDAGASIGNSDRHPGNWLVLPDGRPVAIDHNRAFQYRPELRPKTCWETEIDSIARPSELGRPLERFRSLPAESLAAAVDVLDPPLAAAFVEMRPRVLDRLDRRIRDPDRRLSYTDCFFRR